MAVYKVKPLEQGGGGSTSHLYQYKLSIINEDEDVLAWCKILSSKQINLFEINKDSSINASELRTIFEDLTNKTNGEVVYNGNSDTKYSSINLSLALENLGIGLNYSKYDAYTDEFKDGFIELDVNNDNTFTLYDDFDESEEPYNVFNGTIKLEKEILI